MMKFLKIYLMVMLFWLLFTFFVAATVGFLESTL